MFGTHAGITKFTMVISTIEMTAVTDSVNPASFALPSTRSVNSVENTAVARATASPPSFARTHRTAEGTSKRPRTARRAASANRAPAARCRHPCRCAAIHQHAHHEHRAERVRVRHRLQQRRHERRDVNAEEHDHDHQQIHVERHRSKIPCRICLALRAAGELRASLSRVSNREVSARLPMLFGERPVHVDVQQRVVITFEPAVTITELPMSNIEAVTSAEGPMNAWITGKAENCRC